jgi:hypothetical protein
MISARRTSRSSSSTLRGLAVVARWRNAGRWRSRRRHRYAVSAGHGDNSTSRAGGGRRPRTGTFGELFQEVHSPIAGERAGPERSHARCLLETVVVLKLQDHVARLPTRSFASPARRRTYSVAVSHPVSAASADSGLLSCVPAVRMTVTVTPIRTPHRGVDLSLIRWMDLPMSGVRDHASVLL